MTTVTTETTPPNTPLIHLGFCEASSPTDLSHIGHRSPIWSNWDGGQVGGRPSWLQPRDIPTDFLTCTVCQSPLRFLCQIYAPADQVNSNAFHRSLYVFGCPSCITTTNTTSTTTTTTSMDGSIRVLRGQLPEINPFYPIDPEHDSSLPESQQPHTSQSWNVKLCQVCGQRGKGVCPIQQLSFCGKHHQKENFKYIYQKDKQSLSFLPSVYTVSELVVEEEPPPSCGNGLMEKEAMFTSGKNISGHDNNNDDDDSDQDLEQEDLNQMTGAKATQDPYTNHFYARIQGRPNVQDQCLRYQQWPPTLHDKDDGTGGPLWIRSDYIPKSIPPCPYCQAPRRFEFQLMPQMIHYLLQNHHNHEEDNNNNLGVSGSVGRTQDKLSHESTSSNKETTQQGLSSWETQKQALMAASAIVEQVPPGQMPANFQETHTKALQAMQNRLLHSDKNELDFGVIAVYTCTASCGDGCEENHDGSGGDDDNKVNDLGAYREEYAWRQPPLG